MTLLLQVLQQHDLGAAVSALADVQQHDQTPGAAAGAAAPPPMRHLPHRARAASCCFTFSILSSHLRPTFSLQGWSYSFVIRWRPDIASPNVFPAASDAFWQRLGEDDFVTNHHKQSNFIPFDQWFIVRRARAGAVLSFVDTAVSCIKGDSLRTQPHSFFPAMYVCNILLRRAVRVRPRRNRLGPHSLVGGVLPCVAPAAEWLEAADRPAGNRV